MKRKRNLSKRRHLDIHAEAARDIVFCAGNVTLEAADVGAPPGAAVTAYTGDLLSLPTFPHPVVINLAGVRAMNGEQLPFLRDHLTNKVVGHGKPSIGKTQLLHTGSLSIAGEDRDQIVAASKNGFSWQASVGGRIPDRRKHVQTVPEGATVRVNGRVFQGPISVINAFLWKETSFVAVGADEGRASASIAAMQSLGVSPMNEFEKWLEASGINSDDLNAEQLSSLKAAWTALQSDGEGGDAGNVAGHGANAGAGGMGTGTGGTAAPVDVDAIVRAAVNAAQQQSQRDRRIDRLFASYSDSPLSPEDRDQLRTQVEAGQITEDAAHLQLVLASRGRGGTSNVHFGDRTGGEGYAIEIEAGICRTAGFSEEEIHAQLVSAGVNEDQAERAVTRSNRRPKGLKSIILAICRQEGHHADEVDDDAIRCAMRASAREVEAGVDLEASGWSTVSLPGILSRLANKAMLAAYAEADNGGVATQIASTTSTRDFKKFSRYRMTETGVMEVVPATGEIKHATLTEEEYENQVQTYGKMIGLSRQMMRNDDLDAFLQIPRMIGRMGRHSLEQATIGALVNAPVAAGAGTTEFFHSAARGNQEPNYLVGADTALGIDSLGDAYGLFLNQVDADGKPIMIDPAILLCTNGDIVMARKLYNDTEYRFTTSDRSETINNQWQGMFRPVKSSYLHRLGTTPSALHWFLLSNPSSDVSGVQIAFLDGNQTPIINSSETVFNTLGMQFRGIFDFGVALQDPRAVVKVKGEA